MPSEKPSSGKTSATKRRRGLPRPTKRGWIVLSLSLMLVGLARWQQEPALAQLGLFLIVVMAAAAVIAWLNVQGLRLEREVPPSVFVGHMAPVRVLITNNKRFLDSWSIEVADELIGPFGEGFSAPRLPHRGGVVELTPQVRFRQRGSNPTFRWMIASTFPAGLWRVSRRGRSSVPMHIFPRPIKPHALDNPQAAAWAEGDSISAPSPDWGGEFLGLREFQSGDPLKLIDWKATARTGRLAAREFEQLLPIRYAVYFHSCQPEGSTRTDDAFESALEQLCGLLFYCRNQNVPLEIAAGFAQWQPLRLSPGSPLEEPLKWLSSAKWTPVRELNALGPLLAAHSAEARVFILSDTPVHHWKDRVPPAACTIMCLSVADMRMRRPGSFRMGNSEASQPA